MAAFDQLKRMSFEGIAFPVYSVTVRGGLRDHVHEYPHTPSGAPEKLGRKAYEIRARAPFLNSLLPAEWQGLWPQGLSVLRRMFELEQTGKLHIPTIGTINAYAFDWEQVMDSKIRSGEVCEFVFREDSTNEFLTDQMVLVSQSSITDRLAAFQLEAEEISPQPDLFDQIQSAANSVFAIRDQFELGGNRLEASVLGLVTLCREADATLDFLDDPVNYRLLAAMQDLWLAAVDLHANLQSKSAPLREYTTPIEMAISDVAAAVFGDASKAADILQLNALEDAFAIPAGTRLRYYEQTEQQAA